MKLSSKEQSAFLMYRLIDPKNTNTIKKFFPERIHISDSFELEEHIKNSINSIRGERSALALSGGIDSAILAKFMPKGSIAYTFKCVVPGMDVIDETPIAAEYARESGLNHKIVEIYWEDFKEYSPFLMKKKKAPIHSIEVQIYKASLQAKMDGAEVLLFGEAADAVYGGQSGILSKDWRIGDFIERYSYVMPYKVLREFSLPIDIIEKWEQNGFIDPFSFMSNEYIQESVGSYLNATQAAGIKSKLPYAETVLDTPIDYDRIRSGENKYIVRELFQRLYPGFNVPEKTPMPRPMNEWLRNWEGPQREEFWPNCAANLNGDQKWLLWILEKYLDM